MILLPIEIVIYWLMIQSLIYQLTNDIWLLNQIPKKLLPINYPVKYWLINHTSYQLIDWCFCLLINQWPISSLNLITINWLLNWILIN